VRQAEQTEHELATCIVAPSSFSKQTLIENGVAAQKIKVNPFGVDASHFVAVRRRVPTMLRFVFVGSITARKGVAQLIEVWRMLNPENAELWLVGPATPSVLPLVQGIPNVSYKGAFPHAELPSVLSECDVFVFPSFFEGFALVILEAMACGLPVITTPAAGADVIIEGENGWIVPTGDDAALTAAVERCLTHPEATREAGVHARRTAEECTWEGYGERWADILSEIGQPADGRR
jgi:glycosyltransferase involved in cell wall biosynthesis